MRDYEEFAEPLALPIKGKRYVLPDVGVATAEKLWRVLRGDAPEEWRIYEKDAPEAAEGDADGEAPERKWWTDDLKVARALMGSAYDEMNADDVPRQALRRAIRTAWADFQVGREGALIAWEVGADPEAQAAVEAALAEIRKKKTASTVKSTAPTDPATPEESQPDGHTSTDAETPSDDSEPKPKQRPRRGRGSSSAGGSSRLTSSASTTSA